MKYNNQDSIYAMCNLCNCVIKYEYNSQHRHNKIHYISKVIHGSFDKYIDCTKCLGNIYQSDYDLISKNRTFLQPNDNIIQLLKLLYEK